MRLHPLSLPLRAATRGVSFGAGLFFLGTFGGSAVGMEWAALGPVLAVLGFVAAAAWEVAYHRRFEYDLTPDSLDIRSGVVSRRHREIPLGRIQNVDIRRSLPARALGIAAVGLETAGGGETEAELRYVGYDEARRLQGDVGRFKTGDEAETPAVGGAEAARERGTTGAGPAGAGAADGTEAGDAATTGMAADETAGDVAPAPAGRDRETGALIFALPSEDLLLLSLVSVDPRVASVLFLAAPFVLSQMPETVVGRALFLLSLLGTVVAIAGLWLSSAVVTFARYYGFRLSRVGDDLRYERGLLQRYDGSIPVGKLQTLSIRENPLMRRFGYATLAVETAGYAPGQTPSGGSEAAVPLARRERVLSLARSIESFELGAFERPPKRARRRYAGRYAIVIGLLTGLLFAVDAFVTAVPFPYAPLVLLLLAPVAAHLKWLHRGYYLGEDHVLTRNGFWRRTITVVPYYRVQTVIEQRTVFQRRWHLSSVVVDTAGSLSIGGGGAVAADLDAGVAADLREELHRRMQASRTKRRTGTGRD